MDERLRHTELLQKLEEIENLTEQEVHRLEAENKKLRLCGICKHASPTSMDHLRCYGRGTPYKPVGRMFSCDNFKLLKESE